MRHCLWYRQNVKTSPELSVASRMGLRGSEWGMSWRFFERWPHAPMLRGRSRLLPLEAIEVNGESRCVRVYEGDGTVRAGGSGSEVEPVGRGRVGVRLDGVDRVGNPRTG